MKTLPDGTRVLGTVAAGSLIVAFKGMTVVVHPDHPHRIINFDGIFDMPPDLVAEFNSPGAIHYSAIHEDDCEEPPR